MRRGVPSGRSWIQSRSIAVNTTRLPSGETTGLRIWLAVTIAAVSTRKLLFTSGPTASLTSTWNGILTAAEPSSGTRQSSPP